MFGMGLDDWQVAFGGCLDSIFVEVLYDERRLHLVAGSLALL